MARPTSLAPYRNPADLMGLPSVQTVAIMPANDSKSSWIRQLRGMYETPPQDKITAMEQVLASFQSILAGGALGLVDAYNDGLDVKGVPVDLTAASVLSIAAVAYDSRATARLADSCNTIYGYRKVKSVIAMLGSRMMGGGSAVQETSSVAGEVAEKTEVPSGKDPIVALGETL